MRRPLRLAAALVALALAPPAHALTTTLHVGPPSGGAGGSNPVSLTHPAEYELVFATQSGYETTIGLIPGLLFGKRTKFASGAYAGFGGGLVVDFNGSGPGAYSAIGYDWGMVNFEFKQGLGFSFDKDTVLCPYALRIGVSISW